MKNKLSTYIILIVLIVCGAFLRLWNTDNMSVWVDEVNTAFAAKSLNEVGDDLLPSGIGYGRSQLFVHLVAFSYRLMEFDESGSRIVAGLWGILSIILVFILSKRLYGIHVGLMAAFLMTFSHFEIGWSRVGRMYSLLQFLTLAITYLFLLGFEKKRDHQISRNKVLSFLDRMDISIPHLLISTIVFFISTQYVHLLTLFLLPGFFLYWLIRWLLSYVFDEADFRKKYLLLTVITVTSGIFIFAIFSPIRTLLIQYLSYTPPWAMADGSVGTRSALINFLILPWRFPLAAFFFIGIVFHVTYQEKEGWLPVLLFSSVFLVLTFMFTHRPPRYLFFVYPFFLMISGYGLVKLVQELFEKIHKTCKQHPNRIKRCVIAIFTGMFIISPWLRISVKIPFLEDGKTNMAVYPEEWREASILVNSFIQENDVIISSLPQVSLFYDVKSDYGLNWANLKQSTERDIRNNNDQIMDVYAGIPLVTSLDHIKKIMAETHGHIVISTYHFVNNQYIPIEIRKYIESNIDKPIYTQNGTVSIFSWCREDFDRAF